jgi:uncharacterized protein YcbK (DUF882 family)
MGDVSANFNRSEFACNCGCGYNTVDYGLLSILEMVRRHFEQPITITSGCRCPDYNREIGGASHSQHLLGRAADIQVKNITPKIIQEYLTDTPGGLGSYETFTHVDSRNTKTRWRG